MGCQRDYAATQWNVKNPRDKERYRNTSWERCIVYINSKVEWRAKSSVYCLKYDNNQQKEDLCVRNCKTQV